MTKTVTEPVTKTFCDLCAAEAPGAKSCLNCQRDFCYTCGKKNGLIYKSKLFFHTGNDGFYCKWCHAQLMNGEISSPLFNAYRKLVDLTEDYNRETKSFKQRQEIIERDIEALCGDL